MSNSVQPDKVAEAAQAFANVETPPETMLLLRSYEEPAAAPYRFANKNARPPIPLGQPGNTESDAQAKARGATSQR